MARKRFVHIIVPSLRSRCTQSCRNGYIRVSYPLGLLGRDRCPWDQRAPDPYRHVEDTTFLLFVHKMPPAVGRRRPRPELSADLRIICRGDCPNLTNQGAKVRTKKEPRTDGAGKKLDWFSTKSPVRSGAADTAAVMRVAFCVFPV